MKTNMEKKINKAANAMRELRKHLGKRAALGAGETQTAPEVELS